MSRELLQVLQASRQHKTPLFILVWFPWLGALPNIIPFTEWTVYFLCGTNTSKVYFGMVFKAEWPSLLSGLSIFYMALAPTKSAMTWLLLLDVQPNAKHFTSKSYNSISMFETNLPFAFLIDCPIPIRRLQLERWKHKILSTFSCPYQ